LRRIDGPRAVASALRHPALRDRAAVENALSRYFFSPFLHQEVVEGERFERRARWSRAAMTLSEARVRAVAAEAAAELQPGVVDDLLGEVRRTVTRATVRLTFGEDALEPIVLAAVADFDRVIKMMGRPDRRQRERLRRALTERLSSRRPAPTGTTLAAMTRGEPMDEGSLDDRVDHVACVLLGTGIIQVTDVVTHALVALDQHPRAGGCSDVDVVRETIRLYPVNASLTRRAVADVVIDDVRLRVGQALTVVPERFNRLGWSKPDRFDPTRFRREQGECFGFGHGPRACPARRFATALAETLLASYRSIGVRVEPGYRHRRSLAIPPRAVIGAGPRPRSSATRSAAAWLRYLATCAATYPTVGLREIRGWTPETLEPAVDPAQAAPGSDRSSRDQGPKVPLHSMPH
jgi:cytochrome P450